MKAILQGLTLVLSLYVSCESAQPADHHLQISLLSCDNTPLLLDLKLCGAETEFKRTMVKIQLPVTS